MANPIYLGSFFVAGNKIHVSDPCYDYDSVGAAKIVNALPGNYLTKLTLYHMTTFGTRVARLSIYHANHKNIVPNICTDCLITVDSGQAGFFDDDSYKENQGGDFHEGNTGYENVGIWAWHLISFVDKPPKNFSKFLLVFKEDAR